jgi:hypothetical protein
MNPVFEAKTDGRTLTFETPVRLQNYLFNLKGKKLEVVVRKQRSQRSNNQNNYLWGVVYKLISDATGYEVDEVHDIIKFKFLRKKNNYGMDYVKSTAKMNTTEMEEYLDKVRKWSEVELNCKIPMPNEIDYE